MEEKKHTRDEVALIADGLVGLLAYQGVKEFTMKGYNAGIDISKSIETTIGYHSELLNQVMSYGMSGAGLAVGLTIGAVALYATDCYFTHHKK